MLLNLKQKCNHTRFKKTINFERIVTLPAGSQNAYWLSSSRFFSVLKRIFPKRKTGTRKQRRFWRFSFEKKFKRLTAGAKAYARKAKLRKFIWDKKYGARTYLTKSLFIPSWAKKLARKKSQYKQRVRILQIASRPLTLQPPRKWRTLLENSAQNQRKKPHFSALFKKNQVRQRKLDLWKQTLHMQPKFRIKVWWELLLTNWKKKPVTVSKQKEKSTPVKIEKFFTRGNKTVINWALWSKKGYKIQANLMPKAAAVHRSRLDYVKLGKKWKRKLRFWKYRRSRWKRFEHYRRFSVWRWNNLGKWASLQLYSYKRYRRIHQPFRFSKAKQLKKNRWFRLLNKGYEQGFAINRQVRLRNQQQFTKLYSFFYGFNRPKQIMERSRHFLRLKGSGPHKRNIWLSWLERRLDVVLCRIRLAPSITVARILITRGYIWVNKKQEMNPQKRVQLWDVVEISKNNLAFLRYWYLRNRYQRYTFKYKKLRYRYFFNQKAALPFGFMIKNPFDLDVPKKDLTSVAEVERLFLRR